MRLSGSPQFGAALGKQIIIAAIMPVKAEAGRELLRDSNLLAAKLDALLRPPHLDLGRFGGSRPDLVVWAVR